MTRRWLALFAYLLSNSQLYNGIVRLVQRRSLAAPERYADAIPVYFDSQRTLNVIAKGMGVARLIVLQPFSAFKTSLSLEEDAFQLCKYREDVLEALYDNRTA